MPDRFMWVDDRVLRGGAPTPNELKEMKDKYNVDTIISLDGETGLRIRPTCRRLGLKQELIPLTDGHDPNIAVVKQKLLNLHKGNGRVYLHCFHGKDRTGMAIAMYRVHRGWPLDKALQEAHRIGMGRGLSPKVRRSYFSAVKEFAQGPREAVPAGDIVEMQRARTRSNDIPVPAIGDQTKPNFGRITLPPLADARKDHLNRPASRRIYFCGSESALLKAKQHWFADRQMAEKKGNGSKLFSAMISSDAKIVRYDQDPSKSLIQSALLKEADVIVFKKMRYFVVDPDALVDINEVGEDENDMALQVGLTSNQETGPVADFVGTPGGGIMPGLGAANPFPKY